MKKKYIVRLKAKERQELVRAGKTAQWFISKSASCADSSQG